MQPFRIVLAHLAQRREAGIVDGFSRSLPRRPGVSSTS